MRVVVDMDRCTGLGLCESLAPDLFEIQDDGSLLVLREQLEPGELGQVEEAVRSCPTEALRISD
jgi:ferredoxin